MKVGHRRPVGPGSVRGELLERDAELAEIRAILDDTSTRSGTLVLVEGEAGIGKSSLLDAGAAYASDRGFGVLRARADELEDAHSLGVARSLVERLVSWHGADDLFDGPAHAARGLLEAGGPDDVPVAGEPSSYLHALYWLLVNAAERRPIAIVVDDAHWADEASLRLLAYIGRRMGDLRAAMLIAFRDEAAATGSIGTHLRSTPGARHIALEPLTVSAVSTLIAREGRTGIDAERLAHRAGGNPFYVIELLRGADSTGAGEDTIPPSVQASIRRRLALTDRAAPAVAEAIAVLGDEARVARVAGITGMGEDEVADGVRSLVKAAILARDALTFVHPIVRSAIYDDMPRPVREQLHRRAAAVLADTGAAVESVATQLMHTERAGDPFTAATLVEAGRLGLVHGDPEGAATYLRRAIDEPPPPDARGDAILELANAEAALGNASADALYERAAAELGEPEGRARARLAQGHAAIRAGRWQDGSAAFKAGLRDVPNDLSELKSRLEAGFVSSSFVGLVNRDEAERRLAGILAAPLTDPAHRELAAWLAFQHTIATSASAADAAALARRALDGADLEELIKSSQVVELAAGVFVATGDFDEEVRLLDAALDLAHRLGELGKASIYAYCRSLPNLLTARISDAIVDAQAAMAAEAHGWNAFYPGACASMAWALLERGDVDRAAAALAIDDDVWQQRLDFQFMVPIARGRVALARNDLAGAAAQLERARDAGAAFHVRTPSILADWRTWYAATLARLGRRDEAEAVANEAVEIAETWNGPLAMARALWASALARRGDRVERLRHAVDLVTPTQALLLDMRLRLELGIALRQGGHLRDARVELERVADGAHRAGATAMRDRARAELQATGLRPRRYALTGVEALTPAELRVATMAAGGDTNREIAQVLFVTPKAVEYHLANAYRKLGIASRAELAGALEATPATASV